MKNDWYSESQPEADDWQAAQQADEDAQRQRILDAWQRIKSGLYTDRDIDIIEYELRSVL